MDRRDIATYIVDFASTRSFPLFVGNGYLARDVMGLVDSQNGQVLPLQGGMGLASAVAAGFALARPSSKVVVLEGDGNHLMGWCCAQFIGHLRLRVIHIVSCNGVYQSTGGQPVPAGDLIERASAVATVLGYKLGVYAVTATQVESALSVAAAVDGPSLLYVAEGSTGEIPVRNARNTLDFANAMRVKPPSQLSRKL